MAHIIDAAFLQSVMSLEDYNRVFDRNGTGTVDAAFVTTVIDMAESEVTMRLHGGLAYDAPLLTPTDPGLRYLTAQVAIYRGVSLHPSDGIGRTPSPYRQAYEDAIALLELIRKDQVRLITTNGGVRSRPAVTVAGDTNSDGHLGGVFVRMQQGRDTGAF